MLYVNYNTITYILYDKYGEKHVLKKGDKVDDSVIPDVFNIEGFIPYGMKRTPIKIKEIEESGDR
jgi:hypothetical protein